MRLPLLSLWWSLLLAVCALADESEDRRYKLPYIADAVGNSLPPPPQGPATVGSPVNLLTPDRYEFYTFDESGELVKRLMTLEEIQAIVAAGEETEGLVTFANENQPTIAFNFSQPSYTKVHNVVTNVQNVLKAQMEAHKNKPQTQPTLDTPDVSDSWSLILPSIFGNTGVDIVPDKTSGTFTTPETETIELEIPVDDNSLSKEGSNQIISSTSTKINEEIKGVPVTEKIHSTTEKVKLNPTSTTIPKITTTTTSTTTTTTTTTAKPAYSKPLSTTTKINKTPVETSTTTSQKPALSTSTTNKPRLTTVVTTKVRPTTTTTLKPRTTTTNRPRTTTTTSKITTKQAVQTTLKPTTIKHTSTTESQFSSTKAENEGNYTRVQVQTVANTPPTTEITTVRFEKISTFIPVSTASYVTQRTTRNPTQTTRSPVAHTTSTKKISSTTAKLSTTTSKPRPSVTTYKPAISTSVYESTSTTPKGDFEKLNATTITTQSISPSTTLSSTEFVSTNSYNNGLSGSQSILNTGNNNVNEKETDPPLFDVALSFSQIATDLGGSYRPIPTTTDILDSTKISDINPESKESLEIDIPADNVKEDETKVIDSTDKNIENFVKITTIDPHEHHKQNNTKADNLFEKVNTKVTTYKPIQILYTTTTIDPVLSESMEDLLSQVVNQAPQSIVDQNRVNKSEDVTTEKYTKHTTKETTQTSTTTAQSLMKNDVTTPKISVTSTESKKEVSSSTTNKVAKPADKDVNKLSKPLSVNTEFDSKSQLSSGIKGDLPNSLEHENIKLNLSESVKPEQKDKLPQDLKFDSKINTTSKSTTEGILSINAKKPEELNNITVGSNNTKQEYSKVKDIISETTTPSPSTVIKNEQFDNKEIPFKKVETVSPQSNVNKIENINKFSNKENDKKNSVTAPKLEEFKKKIQKVNIDEKELENERNNSWKLISTVAPPKANEIHNDKIKADGQDNNNKQIVLDVSQENQGLEITTKDLEEDVAQFTELCNELAFRYWQTLIENIDKRRSFVLSPYSITSMLAMMFMGARGATSGEMNEILKLDDMVTFNPHFTLKNISDSLEMSPVSGVAVSAFIREIFSDREKGKLLTFFKERAQHFYNGHVEEVNFKLISDIIRRRTNLLVKRYTWGKVLEYMKSNSITMKPPLAAFSVNIFQTDCSQSSVEGRDGEMYFVVSPNVRQRRLVPVPAVVYRDGFLAGYDPVLDATAAALGNSIVSILFLMPGQQGNVVHAEDLENLEKRLLDSNPTTDAWKRLLRTLLPRMGLELQIPRFSHKSVFNVSSTLQQMGLKDLFNAEHADLGGVIGPSKDLYLSDMVQSTTFVTCGGGVIGEQHHIEEYPETVSEPTKRRTARWAIGWDEPRDYQRAFHDPHDVGEAMHLPLHLRPRQARVPARNSQPARLKFDRPFLYFVRHNPTGMILYVGRYNPRLLP